MIVKKADGHPVRVRRPGLPLGQRLARVSRVGDRLRRPPARRAGRERAGSTRSSRPPPRPRSGTTRTSRSRRWPRRSAPTWPGDSRDLSLAVYAKAAEHARGTGPDPGRHQVRVGPRPRDRRAPPGRRGADPRQLAVLVDWTRTGRAARSRRSTSNSSATGSTPRAGTRPALPPPCPTTWWRRRAKNTSRRTRP